MSYALSTESTKSTKIFNENGYQINVGQIFPLLPEGEGWDEGDLNLPSPNPLPLERAFVPY
ncbi:hypothetical protein CRENPOLYSF2_2570004 [Crenothrix polyspora]|uniref:Uncharacterized protein n=1 Tax=Crenothrix polyspora TaxID=360316 RepID=A0A1R4H7G8_9GAMM|nr:hypothetical protein CRENPOLYSF2_2570004 [Crenothrix polyspora]